MATVKTPVGDVTYNLVVPAGWTPKDGSQIHIGIVVQYNASTKTWKAVNSGAVIIADPSMPIAIP